MSIRRKKRKLTTGEAVELIKKACEVQARRVDGFELMISDDKVCASFGLGGREEHHLFNPLWLHAQQYPEHAVERVVAKLVDKLTRVGVGRL